MTRVVLGSASTGRLSVLRNAGVDPLVIVSGIDEDAVMAAHPDATPADVVRALAAAKADGVAAVVPSDVAADCVVIGCDSMLLVDGRLCGKPSTPKRAHLQWAAMAGKSGELLTGHSLIRLRDGQVAHRESETACTTVHFGRPDTDSLTAYVDQGEPLGVAGGFTLDRLGGWFVDSIEGDPSNVIGLSLPLTRTLFGRLGLPIAALWSSNSRDTVPPLSGE